MKNTQTIPKALLSFLLLTTLQAEAKSLLLDFGPTAVGTADKATSMAHFAGAVPSNEISWNSLAADSTALVYSDGTAATGVTLDLGRSAAGIAQIDFTNNAFSSSALGGNMSSGIYTNTSPMKDGIFGGSGGGNALAIGLRVDGLPAGTYTLYIAGRNTSTGFNSIQRFFCGTGPSAATFSFSTNLNAWTDQANSATTAGLSLGADGTPYATTFAYGDNCTLLTATITTGQSIYLAALGVSTNELRGFLNTVQIVQGTPVITNFPPIILRQPTASQTVYEGSSVSITNTKYAGLPPISYQWTLNETNVSGATGPALNLSNIKPNMAGTYRIVASNPCGATTSSNALINVIPLYNTEQMTNIWSLVPGDRFYMTVTNITSGERGIAYNPATTNLLLMSQSPSNNVVVLDARTGEEKHFLNLSGLATGPAGINMIGVAEDGAVYAVNVTANAGSASTPFRLIRWANDNPNTLPTELLSGDPAWDTPEAAGQRWGDNIAVHGSGANTVILTAPGAGTNIAVFTTSDGESFSPNIITVTGVPSAFARFGIAVGPYPNTFWAKTYNQALYLIGYDLASRTGTVINTYTNLPASLRLINTDSKNHWLAGIMSVATGFPDNVQLYDISDLAKGPVLMDQELYTTQNPNIFLNTGTGCTALGDNYLFALDSQNGIKAFLIDTNYTPSIGAFKMAAQTLQNGSVLVLTWPSVTGHVYQVQSTPALSPTAVWSNVGTPITASEISTSCTNIISDAAQFYRVRGQ